MSVWPWSLRGGQSKEQRDLLVKVSMADEDVVAVFNIVHLEERRDVRRPFKPCVEEDGQAFDF